MNGRVLLLQNSRFIPRRGDLVINWGSSTTHQALQHPAVVLNDPEAVNIAANKAYALQCLSNAEVPVPQYTANYLEACGWLQDGITVVQRNCLTGHSARGLHVLRPEESHGVDFVRQGRLFTKYIKKTHEYRVHVFMGVTIDVQRKMRRLDVPDEQVNWQVRNFDNGFTYGREGVSSDERLETIAEDAVDAMGLDFGAVDIIYNEHNDTYSVLEVNTAPGLQGTTLQKYLECFSTCIQNTHNYRHS
jgi:hypothetical protein